MPLINVLYKRVASSTQIPRSFCQLEQYTQSILTTLQTLVYWRSSRGKCFVFTDSQGHGTDVIMERNGSEKAID